MQSQEFSMEEMREGIRFAHDHEVKVYVTANILAHNDDLEGVREYFKELDSFAKEEKPDALIIADPGVFMIAKEVCPDIERHISTQANNTNYETYRFWYGLGAKRVVSARELSLNEIKELRANIPDDLEIETFIHGAMCISYSGRCLLSNYLPDVMRIREHVHIRAAGNIPSWRKRDQTSICQFMRMSVELIF